MIGGICIEKIFNKRNLYKGGKLLDTLPHRNARTIDYKIYTLANEINNNDKTIKLLTYKDFIKTFNVRVKEIINLINEEEKETTTTIVTTLYNNLKKGLELLLEMIHSYAGELDLVSIKQLTAGELIKLERLYKNNLKNLGYI